MSWSGCSATSGSRLFISIRMAASCGHALQVRAEPRGARTGRGPEPPAFTEPLSLPVAIAAPGRDWSAVEVTGRRDAGGLRPVTVIDSNHTPGWPDTVTARV